MKKSKKQPLVLPEVPIVHPAAAPPNSPSSTQPESKPKSIRKKRSNLQVVAGILIALLISAVMGLLLWYGVQTSPKTKEPVYHVVTIIPGATRQQIAELLQEKLVIRSSSAFLWHIKITGKNSLQAGSYRLSSNLTAAEVANILAGGKTSSVDILIAPGLRLAQIKQRLVTAGFEQAEIEQALEAVRDHPLLKGVPKNSPLEGYLFPDTYKVGPETTAEQLIRLMLDTFEKKITPEIRSGLKNQGLSLSEAIILASIVQKEVSDYPTQQKVAQVFLKRLSEGRVLGSDVTFLYAAAETGQAATPALNSPYNTRKVAGLPPSAIANFNIDALKAVANPAKTTYNYFVAGDNGITYFSDTIEQHEAYTRQYCASCFE